jgi:hypothetical protein
LPSSIKGKNINQNLRYIVSSSSLKFLKFLLTPFQAPLQHLLDYRPANLADDLFDRSPYMTNANGLPDENLDDARWKTLYDGMKGSNLRILEI